jgi:hypothetical protein
MNSFPYLFNSTYNHTDNGYNSLYSQESEYVNISLGQGIDFGFSIGSMFTKNLGIELTSSYLVGSAFTSKQEYISSITYNGVQTTTIETSESKLYSRMFRLTPSLVLQSNFKNLNPYAKLGVVLGKGFIMIENEWSEDSEEGTSREKLYGGLAFGLSATFGANFISSEFSSFFAEVCLINMTYAPLKGKIIEYNVNGIDQLEGMSLREKETEFVDSYSYDSTVQPSEDTPQKQLKMNYPFSSVGINIGWRINL